MSKNTNVNPGQYKVAGRERQGEDVHTSEEKARYTQNPSQSDKKHAPLPAGPDARERASRDDQEE